MSAFALVLPNTYFLSFGVSVVPMLVVIGGAVVVVAAMRQEPDPEKQRPLVVYLSAASFFLTAAAVAGSFAVVSSLTKLISWFPDNGNGNGGLNNNLGGGYYPAYPLHVLGDAVARGAIFGGLLLVASLLALGFHERRARSLAGDEGTASFRVVRSYDALVCFVAVFVALFALVGTVYGLCQLIAPGVFAVPGRAGGLRSFLDSLWVLIAAAVVLRSHLRHTELNIFSMRRRADAAAATTGEAS